MTFWDPLWVKNLYSGPDKMSIVVPLVGAYVGWRLSGDLATPVRVMSAYALAGVASAMLRQSRTPPQVSKPTDNKVADLQPFDRVMMDDFY